MKTTPKDFFLWFGAMAAFYWSIIAFTLLLFNYIDYAFADPLSYLPNPYSSGIPYEMASIVVFFPVYILLFTFIRRDIAHDPSRRDIWVRRWALILTLFIAGVSIAIDLVTLLTLFFSGDTLTTAFLLKVLIIFLVAGGVLLHFIADYRNYWDLQRRKKHLVCISVTILMLASIVAGFFIVGTPQQARLMRFDEQKIGDLQGIQSQIVYYWQQKKQLPRSLGDLTDTISGYTAPLDPQDNKPYTYKITQQPYSFELCATFNAEALNSPQGRNIAYPVSGGEGYYKQEDNWQHGSGDVCFSRTIDPELYAPLETIKR